jgi:hypothetical protein
MLCKCPHSCLAHSGTLHPNPGDEAIISSLTMKPLLHLDYGVPIDEVYIINAETIMGTNKCLFDSG